MQLEYYPLRALLFILAYLPYSWSRRICHLFLQALLAILSKRRHLMDSQIGQCFPELKPAEREQLARHSIAQLAQGLATFARIPRLARGGFQEGVEVEGFEHLDEAYQKGKGMITFTAHYGCWELMAVYVTAKYPRVSMVVRPLDNPRLDALVTAVRGSGGGGVIDSSRVFRDGLRLLRANGILGVLVDQNFYKGGVFVDFFGRKAATSTLVPILARRTGCAVLPMHNVWVGDKIRIVCEPPLTLSSNPDANEAIYEDTQTLTAFVERWVREDPSQWLWLHNRWKRRPEDENASAASLKA